ncbi:hypothetical protein GCM10025734_16420 [Kitasatospora paranensis]
MACSLWSVLRRFGHALPLIAPGRLPLTADAGELPAEPVRGTGRVEQRAESGDGLLSRVVGVLGPAGVPAAATWQGRHHRVPREGSGARTADPEAGPYDSLSDRWECLCQARREVNF